MILEQQFKILQEQGVDPDQIIATLISQPYYDTELSDGRKVVIDARDRVNLKIHEEDGTISLDRPIVGIELLLLQETVRCYLGQMVVEGLMIRKEREMADKAITQQDLEKVALQAYNQAVDHIADKLQTAADGLKKEWEEHLAQSDGDKSATGYHSVYEGTANQVRAMKAKHIQVNITEEEAQTQQEGEANVG